MQSLETAAAPPAVEATRWVAAGTVAAWIALLLAWQFWSAGPHNFGLLLLQVVPLALALPGLLRRRMYTYRWTSLLVWLYVLFALVNATSSSGRQALVAAAEVVLGLVLFTACALHVRLRLRSKPA